MDLPPPPPAIHAPVPARTVQNASPFSMMNARSVHMLTRSTSFDPVNDLQRVFSHFRYVHTRHWKGAKHKSQKARSNKRKAARRK